MRDIFPDTWVAQDALGREVSTYKQCGGPRKKKVGIFYLIWHNPEHEGNKAIYDHTAAFCEKGIEGVYELVPQGPLGFAHYWAQPYFGYYRSDDEWVIRKHAAQLTNAGVDFIFLDMTNGLSYMHVFLKLLNIYAKIRQEGGQTPQFAIFSGCVPENGKKVIGELWETIYKDEKFKDLWFLWEDKPLMLAMPETVELLTPQQQAFFTWRYSWAYSKSEWYTDTAGKKCWPWADVFPQAPGYSEDGSLEQIPVMCGYWANGSFGTNAGRSYRNLAQPKTENFGYDLVKTHTKYGPAFAEQFERAIEIDPDVVMITGWNEWWAGRWDNILEDGGNPSQGTLVANTYRVDKDSALYQNYYVDAFSPEYSRDIEPMRDVKDEYGLGDDYYYQMVDYIRKFKGARPIPKGSRGITIAGFADWEQVNPCYYDNVHDTYQRNFPSFVGGLTYVNNTGRNDFDYAKVTCDDSFWYFYIKTREPVVMADDAAWMNLYIKSGSGANWEGFTYLINRRRDEKNASVEKCRGGWDWEEIGLAEYFISGNSFYFKVPKKVLGDCKTFDFKWADNSVKGGAVMDFVDMGDTAPADRFCYRYL